MILEAMMPQSQNIDTIVDGTGRDILEDYVTWIDTETGEADRHVLVNGQTVVNNRGDDLLMETHTYPLPITVTWKNDPDEIQDMEVGPILWQ